MFSCVFGTPVLVENCEDVEAMNKSLVEIVLREKGHQTTAAQSNIGGWQSSKTFHLNEDIATKSLLSRVDAAIARCLKEVGNGYESNCTSAWEITAWANYNEAHDMNGLHFHTGGFFSGVYFVQGPTWQPTSLDGNLVLYSPTQSALMSKLTPAPDAVRKYFRDSFSIPPVSGTMVLFPSWIRHIVYPHRDATPRVTIAFDVSFKLT